jgi:uncharacterized integral membrane protein (TIGR00698 family)
MVARLAPGVVLLAAIGWFGKWAEGAVTGWGQRHQVPVPRIEYVLWAILLGLVIGNLAGNRPWFKVFEPGIATYELWLKLGIVLLGVRFLLADLARLGGVSLTLVVLEIVLAIVIIVGFSRLFGLGDKLTALLAVGSSICGVSAIIATKGAIEASDEDASFAIAAILALGAAGLFLYPAIGHLLGMSDHAFGLWAGLAVDNTAEAAAAGNLFSGEAGRVAVLAKTTRNAMIGIVVLGAALYFAARDRRAFQGSKLAFVWDRFPKFVLGFLTFSALASAGAFASGQVTSIANASRWAFLLTFAGVGLRINLAEIRRQGVRPFVVGASAELSVAVATLLMVVAADRWLGL